jgi:hypothetical protein
MRRNYFLLSILFLIQNSFAIEMLDTIPAYIHLSFNTTLTAEKIMNKNVFAVSFIFFMDKQLYEALDGEPDEVHCDSIIDGVRLLKD